MSKIMLIDAAHAEETRVAVVDGPRVEEFDFESRARKQLRGNIYLAKVTRVEPSLQAAFVEYGGNRHGFLAFNEIHPDYYQIPIADREAIMAEAADDEDDVDDAEESDEDDEGVSGEEARLRRRLMRRYKIQEVIRRRQILLVQVVKEERGSKGAALTTFLSLAGRYCVLMPNTARGGGISRKITSAPDRKRLKAVAQSLDVPAGMGLIIRTAGAKRTKQEIKRDYEYLLRLWESIRETTLASNAPSLIYEEEDLVKRAIRDMFDKDIEAIFVDGEDGYREAREFMRMIMPSQSRKVQLHADPAPLFVRHKVEDLLQQIHSPVVPLRSGGYLVINQTEALVAIDVNSGRATKERNIEATALKTNLEAADEAARQMRLRDLAGLIVIDFIDMDEAKNNRAVEKRLKDALAEDRARIQMGKISAFGLMEISRQRRRTGVLEGTTHVCEHCQGAGRVRSVESSALQALRALEMELVRGGPGAVTLRLPTEVALYVLNHKRAFLGRLEHEAQLFVTVSADPSLARAEHAVERTETLERSAEAPANPLRARARIEIEPDIEETFDDEDGEDPDLEDEVDADLEDDDEAEADEPQEQRRQPREARRGDGESDPRRRRRRKRRGGRREEFEAVAREPADLDAEDEAEDDDEDVDASALRDDEDADSRPRRRRRGRRGGRRMREDDHRGRDPYVWVRARTPSLDDPYVWFDPLAVATPPAGREGGVSPAPSGVPGMTVVAPVAKSRIEPTPITPEEAEARLAPAPRRRVRARRQPLRDDLTPQAETSDADIAVVEIADGSSEALAPAPQIEIVETIKAAEPRQQTRPGDGVDAAPEPETVPERVLELVEGAGEQIRDPDPAEIVAPPEQPRRGWWRARG